MTPKLERTGPTDRLLIGIDLGTTHTVVAVALSSFAQPEIVPLSQWVSNGQVDQLSLLPSVLYATLPDETAKSQFEWDTPGWVIGEFARRRAREAASRSVVSAKSWLCHDGVDREADILPWAKSEPEAGQASPSAVPRMSPVAASARILRHVRQVLVDRFASRVDDASVVLAVPASFDQVARELTVRAALSAGFDVQLIEEPQAAFYDVISGLGAVGVEALLGAASSRLALVVDVGGGTTDLALVKIERRDGQLACSRVAVGRHLLLGGDNIDLALAHLAENKLGGPLSPADFSNLLLAVRAAKEALLGPGAPLVFPVTVTRAGARLVGSTLRVELTREEVVRLVLEGFLPEVGELSSAGARRAGLVGFGLPYERDTAITRHIARFILRHQAEVGLPEAVLFNGGLFRAPQAADRVRQVLSTWLERPLAVIENVDPDLAVARGAVVHAQAQLGNGVSIESHAAHGYYVGLGGKGDALAMCVVPRGAREGNNYRTTQLVGLSVGQTSRFDLFASDTYRHQVGEVVALNSVKLRRIARLTTTLPEPDAPQGGTSNATLPVFLEGVLSAVGTLQLAAVDPNGGQPRYQLAFELRGSHHESANPARETASVTPAASGAIAQACELVSRVFGKGRSDVKEREVKDLLRELERVLGPRRNWTLTELRCLFDVLMPEARARRRSADHERMFFLLAGYCLRPGFGHALDAERVEKMAPLFQESLSFDQERRGWEAFLIAWRRIAPGLSEHWQVAMRDRSDPVLAPAERKLKKVKNFRPSAEEELLWLCTWLERVPQERRQDLGQWILERTWTSRNPVYFEMLGRIGARVPVYASAHHVIEPRIAERWLEHLLSENWQTLTTAAQAAVSLARMTGDRARDVSSAVRKEVLRRLETSNSPTEWVTAVREHVPMLSAERAQSFGDDLPIGLSLLE